MYRLAVLPCMMLLLFLTAGCIASCEEDTPEAFAIAWSYDTSGYLETCGCSANQLGGLAHRGALLDRLRSKQPVIAIEGAHFIEAPGEFQLFKGAMILKSLELMDYDAAVIGIREAQHGKVGLLELEQEVDYPLICSNLLVDGTPWPEANAVINLGRLRIGIVAASQPELVNFELPDEISFSPPKPALEENIAALNVAGADLIVACLEGGTTWIQQIIASDPGADVYLSGNRNPATADFSFTSEPPHLNNWKFGKQLGLVFVDVLNKAGNSFHYSGTTVPVVEADNPHGEVSRYISEDYRSQLKNRFFTQMKTDLEQLYLPPEVCADCHPAAYESYLHSSHSRALETLLDAGQLYNPDCMHCHVVYDPGADTLQPLNCVACHTSITEKHLWNAVNGDVSVDTQDISYTFDWCSQCHDELNSLPFAEHWPKYVHRIYHGGDQSAADAAAKQMGLDPEGEIPH